MTPGSVAVWGCGLIGASLAAAWSRAGLEVWGCDHRSLEPLGERGWIARQVGSEELARASIVVLALPVPEIVRALDSHPFESHQLVTDTGSVKRPMAAAASRRGSALRFVGGHPLAGNEGSGYEAADPEMFEGASWALVQGEDEAAVGELEELVRRIGARPVRCTAADHDRVVARTSHLPQLLATALAAEMSSLPAELVDRLTGPGARGLLRLASSPFALWREILEANRDEVASALQAVAARAGREPAELEEDFRRAAELARRLLGP